MSRDSGQGRAPPPEGPAAAGGSRAGRSRESFLRHSLLLKHQSRRMNSFERLSCVGLSEMSFHGLSVRLHGDRISRCPASPSAARCQGTRARCPFGHFPRCYRRRPRLRVAGAARGHLFSAPASVSLLAHGRPALLPAPADAHGRSAAAHAASSFSAGGGGQAAAASQVGPWFLLLSLDSAARRGASPARAPGAERGWFGTLAPARGVDGAAVGAKRPSLRTRRGAAREREGEELVRPLAAAHYSLAQRLGPSCRRGV